MVLCSEILLSVSVLHHDAGNQPLCHYPCSAFLQQMKFRNARIAFCPAVLARPFATSYVAGLLELSLQRAISTASDVQEQVHGERDPSLFVQNLACDRHSPKKHPAQASESQPWIRDLRQGQNTMAKVRESEPTRNRIQFQDEDGREELRKRRERGTQKREVNCFIVSER